MTPEWKKKLASLPTSAGVYLFKDAAQQILYVGKARNLKQRVSSYFSERSVSPKTEALVPQIENMEVILVPLELDALLLERELIKQHRPFYNILLRDDKEYPLLRIRLQDPWPRFQVVRRRKKDGALYLGPYGSGGQLRKTLQLLHTIFPLIRCTEREFANVTRPCNYYHMKKCLGPCHLPVDRSLYMEMVNHSLDFLQGKNHQISHELEKKMKEASQQEDYEQAAIYRDQWRALHSVQTAQSVSNFTVKDVDAIGLVESHEGWAFSLLSVREHQLISHYAFVWHHPVSSLEEGLQAFLLQYYETHSLPSELILPMALLEAESCKSLWKSSVTITLPKRGEKKKLQDLCERNAAYALSQSKQDSEESGAGLQGLQQLLGVATMPQRVECIDISNLGSTAIVASCVCFIGGKPSKAHYRLYNLKTVHTQDDFSSIEEIVTRRLSAIETEGAPDVLVIDGGKGQLGAAWQARAQCDRLEIPVISLAKSRLEKQRGPSKEMVYSDERVFLSPEEEAVPLEKGTALYRLLTHLRDEAHRFAISHHRTRRRRLQN